MCGITGFWAAEYRDGAAIAGRMAQQIVSRGPDDCGVWTDEKECLGLAHRRLSILDLSEAGHQPMHSECGRYTIVYNGEIYNHLDIRTELEASGGVFGWRGHSDTETLLAAVAFWGLEGALSRLNGMFAFALWDSHEHTLFLTRDRLGEKPLYFGRVGDTFLFGSELKALAAHPSWTGEIDRNSLALFIRHNYVPAPRSIYRNIGKLPPAHLVAIRENGRNIGAPICYWDLGSVAEQGTSEVSHKSEREFVDELDGLLRDAIGRRMIADVPLGAFLSGGYDSSTVVALMQAQSTQPVKTFSIGFHEEGYNEADHARAVAEHLGTDHTELYVSPEKAMSVIPKLPGIYDEPFSDSSQIPTYLVSELARHHVTVSLSGDGGDELFFGYGRYFTGERIWKKLEKIPGPLRQLMALVAHYAPGESLERVMAILPKSLQVEHLADRLPKLAEVLAHSSGEALYRQLVSHSSNPEKLVIGASEPDTLLSRPE